jgi:hypothetical protein
MNPINFRLRFANSELADAIINSKPPEGVVIAGSLNPIIRATHGADMVFNVNFDVSIPLTAFVVWLVAILKQRYKVENCKKKSARINDQNVPLKNKDIMLVIKSVLFYQKLRETQKRIDQKKKVERKKKKL